MDVFYRFEEISTGPKISGTNPKLLILAAAARIRAITLPGEFRDANTPSRTLLREHSFTNTSSRTERIVTNEKILHQTEDLVCEFPAYSYTIPVYQR